MSQRVKKEQWIWTSGELSEHYICIFWHCHIEWTHLQVDPIYAAVKIATASRAIRHSAMAALCNEANAEKVTICHQEQQAVISGLTVGKCHMTQLWLHSSGREKVISKSWKQLQLQDEIHFVFCNTLNQTFSVGECNYVQLLFNSSGLLSSSKVKRIVHSVVIFQMEEWCRWIEFRWGFLAVWFRDSSEPRIIRGEEFKACDKEFAQMSIFYNLLHFHFENDEIRWLDSLSSLSGNCWF